MAKLTYEQEHRHAQACQLIDLARDLTDEERAFVLDNWRASSTARSASDRAHFTPAGLAGDLSIAVGGNRIIDLAAGIGRLAFHCRNLWARWPDSGPEFVCIERHPEYVRVGRRVMPEAHWICADIMTIPALREEIGEFDCAVSNPPFGAIPRAVEATSGYHGRRFEYHAIALASMVARRGVFIIPQATAPFRHSGRPVHEADTGDAEYRKFVAATGIELEASYGIDTTLHQDDWHDVNPRVEVVCADFTERVPAARRGDARRADYAASADVDEQAGQLALLAL